MFAVFAQHVETKSARSQEGARNVTAGKPSTWAPACGRPTCDHNPRVRQMTRSHNSRRRSAPNERVVTAIRRSRDQAAARELMHRRRTAAIDDDLDDLLRRNSNGSARRRLRAQIARAHSELDLVQPIEEPALTAEQQVDDAASQWSVVSSAEIAWTTEWAPNFHTRAL